MKTSRNQTATNQRPNVVKPPGLVGKNRLYQGYPSDRRVQHVSHLKTKKKKQKKE